MKDMSAFEKVKTGFWLGVGLIIPLLVSSIIGIVISFASTPMMMNDAFMDFNAEEEMKIMSSIPQIPEQTDLKDQIEIVDYQEHIRGDRLLILGVLKNKGPQTVSSIKLQAELFDSSGQFVLECDEYISGKLNKQEKENFQIRCGGCSDSPVPEYSNLSLRVLSADNY